MRRHEKTEDLLKASSTYSDDKADKPSILGALYITFLVLIGTLFMQFVFLIPLLINGMLTLDMFNLPPSEFSETLGIKGEAFILLAELIALIICIKIAFHIQKIPFSIIGFKLNGYKTDAVLGALAGIIIITICFFLLVSTGYISYTVQSFSLVPWVASCSLFLLVAVSEEILCRGFIQGLLMRATTPYLALFISSVIFMALHLGNVNWTLISLINLFLAGVTFGLYYLYTRNLWFPITLHFTWNLFQGTVFGFEVSGHKMASWLAIVRTENSLITGGKFGLEGSILVTALEILLIVLIQLKFTSSKSTSNERKLINLSPKALR
ncbi:CPBP family intramembrane glutamic endopeptidase [Thalassotalea sediminis]|uniref:CPBP family intramembrane glutamic endopeptidase n=1 Tax=Thalassotalea sediminis TaxID=1759089 RepID=UPI00257420D4|nr:type II CAAX endopeptidase family protein [Thalassotalea sediminis]